MLFSCFSSAPARRLSRAFSSAEIITDSVINSTRFAHNSRFFFALRVRRGIIKKLSRSEGLLCLICSAPCAAGGLRGEKTVWRCESRHSFDVARSGYVNLLPPSASGKRHGDDKRMVAARTAFLSRGYYDHLIGAVAGSCAQLTGPDACVLDAGCGEGRIRARSMTRLRQRAAARSCSARIFPQRPSDGRHGRCRRGSSARRAPRIFRWRRKASI